MSTMPVPPVAPAPSPPHPPSPADPVAGPLRRPHPGNQHQGRDGLAPRAVVVHTTDGTFDGTVGWFASPDSRVSAHHLVRLDGRVAHLVDEADTAFHSGSEPRPEIAVLGTDAPNLVTIGIEFDDAGRPHDIDRPAGAVPRRRRAAGGGPPTVGHPPRPPSTSSPTT